MKKCILTKKIKEKGRCLPQIPIFQDKTVYILNTTHDLLFFWIYNISEKDKKHKMIKYDSNHEEKMESNQNWSANYAHFINAQIYVTRDCLKHQRVEQFWLP